MNRLPYCGGMDAGARVTQEQFPGRTASRIPTPGFIICDLDPCHSREAATFSQTEKMMKLFRDRS